MTKVGKFFVALPKTEGVPRLCWGEILRYAIRPTGVRAIRAFAGNCTTSCLDSAGGFNITTPPSRWRRLSWCRRISRRPKRRYVSVYRPHVGPDDLRLFPG